MTRLQDWAPCPFCKGRYLTLASVIHPAAGISVQCRSCGATGPRQAGADQAIAAWDSRGGRQQQAAAAQATALDVRALQAAALEQGTSGGASGYGPRIVHGCQAYKQSRGPRSLKGRGGAQCRGKVVAAVAFRMRVAGETGFLFVCGVHRNKHKLEPDSILTTLELPDHLTAPLRQAHEREQREAQELRDHRRAHGLCPACGELTDPDKNSTPYCRGWHEVPDRRYLRILGPHTATCDGYDGTGWSRRCDGNCPPPERQPLALVPPERKAGM